MARASFHLAISLNARPLDRVHLLRKCSLYVRNIPRELHGAPVIDPLLRERPKDFGKQVMQTLFSRVFDPQTAADLGGAFDDAWSELSRSRSQYTEPDIAEWTRERLASHIIEMAQSGERDRERLRVAALASLERR